MKCKHKDIEYTYNIGEDKLELCRDCEETLLIEIIKQFIIENKSQVITNIMFDKRLEELEKRVE